MIKLPDVTKQELLEAIRAGVRDAMWEMVTNATAMPCADFFDTVKDAIQTAVSDAMPFENQISNAITDGVKEAMREGKMR